MPEAMVNGVRIWYQETGAGEPVVQIHGAGFGHFNFATATPILSKSFRCIDFDMRGYGQSERPFQRYDMEVWADDVLKPSDTDRIVAIAVGLCGVGFLRHQKTFTPTIPA
jgi:pimeloyl-ACP methyl ester carboxylesterase